MKSKTFNDRLTEMQESFEKLMLEYQKDDRCNSDALSYMRVIRDNFHPLKKLINKKNQFQN
ncbi:hypothetical protein Bcop_1317 [Bacteroides coprosuis DSM 18011]|uniref:Uncharacterized protein n=1 Tax=Bacteroides coprosuis DSM 18011 TaxID=679937 RepID=F3ZNU0_9BACE|nr:hypothetical protein [Bacteroides coprosuis]EGJ71516.1 hypothetical protein Bcop_1317 [Bacteroides coprosuis DSM 18011]